MRVSVKTQLSQSRFGKNIAGYRLLVTPPPPVATRRTEWTNRSYTACVYIADPVEIITFFAQRFIGKYRRKTSIRLENRVPETLRLAVGLWFNNRQFVILSIGSPVRHRTTLSIQNSQFRLPTQYFFYYYSLLYCNLIFPAKKPYTTTLPPPRLRLLHSEQ